MATNSHRKAALAAGLLTIALSGCSSYIQRDEFDTTIADLRAADQRMQSQLDALSQKYDALVTQMAGRMRVETGAHFATGDATLSEQDKPLLDDFAKVMSFHTDAVVTVEGFADPAGPSDANRSLGQRRAEAVRDYLASSGVPASQLRAVSYGEDQNRQVRPGATGEGGQDNRRASLVIDYAGAGTATPAMQPAPEPAPET
jgi:peptidoglycan-associated lipoprotein